MTTPSHIIYSLAILGRKSSPKYNPVIFLGALVPDLCTYIFFLVMTFIYKVPSQKLWSEVYFQPAWQIFFGLTHSLWIWPLGFCLAMYFHKEALKLFFASGLLHIGLDFFVHSDDAYAHFAPLTNWKFYSPISYYDPQSFW